VAFVALPRTEQVQLFMQINENQQAVPKNLRNTLNADLLWESDDIRERVKALKLRIAQVLGESKTSPLYGRIIIGENPKTFLRCITIDAISSGLERSNFIGTFTKSEMRSAGTFYRGTNDGTFAALVPFLNRCFGYMKDGLPTQWSLGSAEGGFVFINNGIESMLRIFGDIVDHLVETEHIDPSQETPQELFELAQVYLDPMIAFLGSMDADEAIEFRRLYGSGGKTRYWRNLQGAIKEVEGNFSPAGLQEYQAAQEKEFNTESFNMIRDIEHFFNQDIRRRLEDEYGNRWFKDGVPSKVYQDASALAVTKNQTRDEEDEVEPWDCLHLIDYYSIVGNKHDQWQKLFERQYTLPWEQGAPGGWKKQLTWMVKLNDIRNENDHSYAVTEEEYEFLVAIWSWLVNGQSDGVI
jgi:DNA sulfur modification protein DndB